MPEAYIMSSAFIVNPAPQELFEDVKYFYNEIKNINEITIPSQRFIRIEIILSVMSIEAFLNEEIENLLKEPEKSKKFIEWQGKYKNKGNFDKGQSWEYYSPIEKWRLFLSLITSRFISRDKLDKSKKFKNFSDLNRWRKTIVHRTKKKNHYEFINLNYANRTIRILSQSLKFLYRIKEKKIPNWLKI